MKPIRKLFGTALLVLLFVAASFAGEVYKLTWVQSPSTFLETQKVYAVINGATEVQIGGDLAANVSQLQFEFTTNATVVWRVVSIGDNSSTASSITSSFTAVNQASVLPATGLNQQFIQHND